VARVCGWRGPIVQTPGEMREIYQRLAELEREGRKAVLVLLAAAEGPVPREAGTKMLVFPNGTIEGTIGGGSLEKAAIEEALSLFEAGGTLLRTYNLEDLGMICGGRATLYYELISPAAVLHIFGAGHVGKKLFALAREVLPFELAIYDVRPEAAGEHPAVTLLPSYADVPPLRASDYVFICTHSHEEDYRALKGVLSTDDPPVYVGLVGSRPKWAKMQERLRAEGVSQERVKKVRCPVGLPLGGKDPGAIAVSALAEILAHYHGRLTELERGR